MQRVDGRLIEKVNELVREGVTSVAEMQRHLQYYVKKELFSGMPAPDSLNRRFYPSRTDIYNYMYRASSQMRHSKIDQENLTFKIEEWQAECPQDMFFFRPGTNGGKSDVQATTISENEDTILWQTEDENSNPEELLFVHQTAWQKRLLQKYGNEICLLDATYKTSRYALPLFFLCIKTNVDYCVVGSFVVQRETRRAIAEALSVLRKWNPMWSPRFFMTDFSDPEIKAIEGVFKGRCGVF